LKAKVSKASSPEGAEIDGILSSGAIADKKKHTLH
jgi:hypothetical protein